MASNIKRGFSFGFDDQIDNGFTLSKQSARVPKSSEKAPGFGIDGPASTGTPFDPFGGFSGGKINLDTDFGMDFGALNQADSVDSPEDGDIGFGTKRSAVTGMSDDDESKADNPESPSPIELMMQSLMAKIVKIFQYSSPNIDGADTSIAANGAGDSNYSDGDINDGVSDSGSDKRPARHRRARSMAVSETNSDDSTSDKAGINAASRAAAGSVAPGPTYVDADPALLAEITQREKSDPAGAAKLRELSQQPVTHWLNGTPYDAQNLDEYLNKAQAAGKEGSVMFYNIPGRDNGGYSGGGAKSVDEYKAWAKQMSGVIGDRKTTVYLETDAIMLTKDMSPEKADERLKLIGETVTMLKKNNPNATVVLNAGSAGWGTPAETAALLKRANVQNADGFFLNVAGFESTADSMRHGDALVSELDKLGITGKRYIIDTSRNGAKIAAKAGTPEAWADPYGAASGTKPTTDQAIIQNPNVMALSWVKTPWNSDGRLSNAGAMVADYAIKLVDNARQQGV